MYLCLAENTAEVHKRKINFLVELDLALGDQKIDVIIAKDKNLLVEQEALTHGIEL